MKLYFKNSSGKERLIAEPFTLKEVNRVINVFLKEHNFKSYYTKIQLETIYDENTKSIKRTGRMQYDVGSHTEFFYLDELTDDAKNYFKDKKLYE